MSSLDKLGVLLLENRKVLFSFPVPDAVRGEEQVHLLKSALVGLRVQAVDHGQGDDIGDAEDVVSLLLKGLEDNGKEECQPPVANGPTNHTPCVTLCTDLQGEDLSRVQPWDREPGSAEGCCEEEDHGNSAGAGTFSRSRTNRVLEANSGESTSQEHRDTLNDRAPVQGPATTDPVQSEDANESSHLRMISTYPGNRHKATYHVGNGVQPRDPLHLAVRDTSGTEDGRSEDSHTGDTDPLLHDLKPDNELYTAASV